VEHRRSPVVLVAEDDDDCRDLYLFALERAGFVAHGVDTVTAARALLETVHPDVLVADFGLPDGTGADLMKLCEASNPEVCILLTGFDAEDVDATGFHVVLVKPIAVDDLVGVIRSHMTAR
jgi:DNA-binding response OmpR family regulator